MCLGVNVAKIPEVQLLAYSFVVLASEPDTAWWLLLDPESGEPATDWWLLLDPESGEPATAWWLLLDPESGEPATACC